MKKTLSILVENSAGVLSQVTRLFSRKNWNIDSLAVGTTQEPSVSRITVMVEGSEQMLRQVEAQLGKLLPVLSVSILDDARSIHREFVLVKVSARDKDTRDEIISIVNVFRASIVDIGKKSLMIAVTGDEEKNNAMVELLRDFGILELARTGMIALERGEGTIYDSTKSRSEYDFAKSVVHGEKADE